MSLAAPRPLRSFIRQSALRVIRSAQPEPHKWRIARGDLVAVRVRNNKNAATNASSTTPSFVQGRVRSVDRARDRMTVEGVNLVRKHVRASEGIPGGIVSIEAPVRYSRVALVDPVTGKGTRIVSRFKQDGTRVRLSAATGSVIPLPPPVRVKPRMPADTSSNARVPVTAGSHVKSVTYVPGEQLKSYLAPAGGSPQSIFNLKKVQGGAHFRLRLQDMPRHARKRVKARWDEKEVKSVLAKHARSSVVGVDVAGVAGGVPTSRGAQQAPLQ